MEWFCIIIILIASVIISWLIYQLKNFKAKNVYFQKEIDDLSQKNVLLKKQNTNLSDKNNNLEVSRKLLEHEAILAAEEKSKLEEKLAEQVKELFQLQSSIQVDVVKNDAAENLDAILEKKNNELVQLNASAELANSAVQEKLARLEELEASIRALEGRIVDGRKGLEELEAQIKLTESTLTDLSNLKASVLKVEEGVGNVWELTPGKNKHLIELIHELVDTYGGSYPILQKELLKVEWSIVWLPQLQQLCVRENLDRSGIYKLTSKANDKIVYIGQAVSIKDRWYTHCKKMLGVEAKGTERLYDFRPDELTWEVVEFKNGNLDDDEKYWIDYFKCREVGLNKKR